jgi:hypothetical protein
MKNVADQNHDGVDDKQGEESETFMDTFSNNCINLILNLILGCLLYLSGQTNQSIAAKDIYPVFGQYIL